MERANTQAGPSQSQYIIDLPERVLSNLQAHAYITSDNKWVVFNSDRTGVPQVYIASIPKGFLEELQED